MAWVKNAVMAPYWFVGIFGQAKSFRDNPLLGSVFLNRCGLHVARVLIARSVAQFRWALLRWRIAPEHRVAFQRDGFVCIDGFIDGEKLVSLQQEILAHPGPVRQFVQRGTATQRILLDDAALLNQAQLTSLTNDPRLLGLLSYCGAKASRSLFYVQRIRNGIGKGHDPQKTLHSDTFHPTAKAWLFLEDVKEEQGPFNYVRGSSRLTWSRLKWEYARSISVHRRQDGYSEKGSFRADDEDLKALGLEKPVSFSVRAGTLVIANTNGFHCRGSAMDGSSRLSIWMYSRHNPFNPWPGLSSKFVQRIECKLVQAYWSRKDKEAATRRARSTWHLVERTEMFP